MNKITELKEELKKRAKLIRGIEQEDSPFILQGTGHWQSNDCHMCTRLYRSDATKALFSPEVVVK